MSLHWNNSEDRAGTSDSKVDNDLDNSSGLVGHLEKLSLADILNVGAYLLMAVG